MRSLIIPGMLVFSLIGITSVFAADAPQSDYDRVMSGVNSSTKDVLGPQPGTPAVTTTTKTVNGPLPVTNGAVGMNNAGIGGPALGFGGPAYGFGAGVGSYGNAGIPTPPVLNSTGTSTTTTTTTGQ